MLPLEDPRWAEYTGGYRVPYDASGPLRRLLRDGPTPQLWEELWSELHHQGDVGAASYAAVPYLVEFVRRQPSLNWNALALIAVIELARPKNPTPPAELRESYAQALEQLPGIIVTNAPTRWDEQLIGPAVACIALARGQRLFARAYLEMSTDGARGWLLEQGYSRDEML